MFTFPGLFLAKSMNSVTVFAGDDGGTTIALGIRSSLATGVMS